MIARLVTTSLVLSAFAGAPAIGQVTPPPMVNPNPSAVTGPSAGFASPDDAPGPAEFITRRPPWVLRTSDLVGHRVYGPGGEDVGEVEDVLINRDGQLAALVIEVGGFLGIGGRQIAVPPRLIRLDPHGMTTTTGTIPGAGLPPSTAAGAEGRREHRISRAIVPERLVLILPVDELRAAPPYLAED